MHLTRRAAIVGGALFAAARGAQAQTQGVDPDYRPAVASPAFAGRGYRLTVDAAHRNFHTAADRYAPFAGLMAADGWQVDSNQDRFTRRVLRRSRVLVIANAGSENGADTSESAFTEQECISIERWLRRGGNLLFIADHAPFGVAAQILADHLGFSMGKGWAYEPSQANGLTTQFVFTHENQRLGQHPIMEGRHAGERISTVRSFTGQSLTLPAGAAPLLRLAADAREAANRAELDRAAQTLLEGATPADPAVGDRCQGFAMTYGVGRLVVLGEAAMLTAQVLTLPGPEGVREVRVGMNVSGYDNQQFALNVVRWLGRAL